jgi:CHASE1-domain containing sensor protein
VHPVQRNHQALGQDTAHEKNRNEMQEKSFR